MKSKFKVLVLTDHRNHSAENSLYSLVKAMRRHPQCAQIDIATRGNNLNEPFFNQRKEKSLMVVRGDHNFSFRPDGRSYHEDIRREALASYDVIWLRIPPPVPEAFLKFLSREFPDQLIINNPEGILQTGSKEFLLHFPDLCPPMKICRSPEDIIEFKNRFPIVLKPLRDYGGKGIVRIDGERVWEGRQERTFSQFAGKINGEKVEYLGVKFLKNVAQGDKRIVVVTGKILGASLRLPPEGSWIANVAMGGSSHFAEPTEEEVNIVTQINPVLARMGIVMYGIDTLVDDSGKRVLSEINTTSIGGLPQIGMLLGKPIVKEAVQLISAYITEKMITQNVDTN